MDTILVLAVDTFAQQKHWHWPSTQSILIKNMEDLGTTLKAKWLACLLKHDLFGSSSMLSILRHVVVWGVPFSKRSIDLVE
jgi:hypothetical protein